MSNENYQFITPLHEDSTLPCFQGAVEDSEHLSLAWLKEKKWRAVPVPSGRHIPRHLAQGMADAIHRAGYSSCFALSVETLAKFPNAFRVPATAEGLDEFSSVCSHFNFALLPEDCGFIILCLVYDYFVVAGPVAFVEEALGMSLGDALNSFYQEAYEERLVGIGKRYEAIL